MHIFLFFSCYVNTAVWSDDGESRALGRVGEEEGDLNPSPLFTLGSGPHPGSSSV